METDATDLVMQRLKEDYWTRESFREVVLATMKDIGMDFSASFFTVIIFRLLEDIKRAQTTMD